MSDEQQKENIMTDKKQNTGHSNTGDWNTGHSNTGHRNTSDRNTGNKNTSDRNTGYKNTGDRNTGSWNTGDRNTGDCNTGDKNTGDRNTGYRNTGHSNTGYRNTGDCNTGDWNTCDKETGYFNTVSPTHINVFNKPCPIVIWNEADKPSFIYFKLTEWILKSNMTDEEKTDNATFKTTGGYLKSYGYQEAFQASYAKASDEDKALLLKLPNFDAEVFKEISGIDVTVKATTCEGKIVEIEGVKYQLKEVKP